MKNTLILITLLTFGTVFSQDLPDNPEPGKCYQKCFDYNAKLSWMEIDCSSINQDTPMFYVKGEEKMPLQRKLIKFKKYQEMLVDLGYKLTVTGRMDTYTIKAHHKYLKDQKKAARKRKRKNRQ